jgi:hypothetical protein
MCVVVEGNELPPKEDERPNANLVVNETMKHTTTGQQALPFLVFAMIGMMVVQLL